MTEPSTITGLHHVTAIAGDPQENLNFYSGALGLRLVKRTVNQDVPNSYHLFYADGEAHPGADLTFFPWPDQPPARRGTGLASEIALAVPVDSIDYWIERLARSGAQVGKPETRRGARALPLVDPHGLDLALVETADEREFSPWAASAVPAARQIRGLHAVRLWERDIALSARFLTATLDFTSAGEEDGWHRYTLGDGGSGRQLEIRELPQMARGSWGTGVTHHVAWRVPDDPSELAARERIAAAHRRPTEVIDRFWFKSVYFLEPGGVLFELATDGPGFTADEEMDHLGERLVLPPWLEPRRQQIVSGLPPLEYPPQLP